MPAQAVRPSNLKLESVRTHFGAKYSTREQSKNNKRTKRGQQQNNVLPLLHSTVIQATRQQTNRDQQTEINKQRSANRDQREIKGCQWI